MTEHSERFDAGAARSAPHDGAGWTVLLAGLEAADARFGERLNGAYALGSLAHGGFSPEASDVDLALIVDRVDEDLAPAMAQIRAAVLVRLATPLSERLSLFWSSWSDLRRPSPRGRFPLVDRIDLVEAGRCLRGPDRRSEVLLPSGEARRSALVIEAATFMLDKLAVPAKDRLLADPGALVALGNREVTKAVLFPIRFLYTLGTGRADGNAPAVDWYVAQPGTKAPTLAGAALAWRSDGLDAGRALSLLERELIPLYRELLDAYVSTLRALGRPDLVVGLEAWRSRLDGVSR